MGAEYKQGGDIQATIENNSVFQIPEPCDPLADYATAAAIPRFKQLVFEWEIDSYIKHKGLLQENIQKAYSLILGQCTKLMKSKLKSSDQWATISAEQNVLKLLAEIKSITFKFEDQKYLPLSIHQAKANFYAYHQKDLSNAQHLERFNNLVDISTSYEGNLHDQAITKFVSQQKHQKKLTELTKDERKECNEEAKEIYLAVAFIHASDRKRYGKLIKDLENDHTKGNNNYPKDMVKAYQLLNEFKQFRPSQSQVPDAIGVTFMQQHKNHQGKIQ